MAKRTDVEAVVTGINAIRKLFGDGDLSTKEETELRQSVAMIEDEAVSECDLEMIKKKVRAVIIRQRQTIRRANGLRVRFEDNAGVLVTDADIAVGTEIKGAMAREVVERYIKLAGIASRVI